MGRGKPEQSLDSMSHEVKTNPLLRRGTAIPEAESRERPAGKGLSGALLCPCQWGQHPLGVHDPLRLKSGAESTGIKDPGGWNGSPGSIPSFHGLGRIPHPSPSLNTASAQNSQSRRGCQEAPGRDLARPAHRRAQWANEHTCLMHKGAPSLGNTALPGRPPPTRLPPLATRHSHRTQEEAATLPQGGLSRRSQM